MFGRDPSHDAHLGLVWIVHRPGPQQELLGLLRPLDDGWIPVSSVLLLQGERSTVKVKGGSQKAAASVGGACRAAKL